MNRWFIKFESTAYGTKIDEAFHLCIGKKRKEKCRLDYGLGGRDVNLLSAECLECKKVFEFRNGELYAIVRVE